MKAQTITSQIEETAFNLLKKCPKGIRWSELNHMIIKINPNFHPKTINGTLWKLPQKYPNKIFKENGIFRVVSN